MAIEINASNTPCKCKMPVFEFVAMMGGYHCVQCGGVKNPNLEEIMPGKPKLMPVGEGALDGNRVTDIEFIEELNPVSIFRFRDGSLLKARMVLMHVERVEGAFNPDGTPMYRLGWQQVVYIVAPPEICRK